MEGAGEDPSGLQVSPPAPSAAPPDCTTRPGVASALRTTSSMVHDADATDSGANRPGYSEAVTLSVSRQNPGPIFLVLEPILLRFRHLDFRRNVGRAAHS